MANPLLLDIVTFLVSKNRAAGDGIDVFRDFTPEEPDSAIVLHEYPGDPASLYDDAVHRSVQISVRNKKADVARQNALEIFKTFRDAQNEDGKILLTTDRWGQVYLRQTPFFLKRDENNRTLYAFNIGITTTIE